MRYAIYYTPQQQHALTVDGAAWLGRDAFTGDALEMAAERQAIVAVPARYGFHATLKAPFELHEEKSEEQLLRDFRAFCQNAKKLTLPALSIAEHGETYSLVGQEPNIEISDLAASAVEYFEPYRKALNAHDIARRKPEQLSERQYLYLHRYGYPYVMEEFRFHMTLTGDISPFESARLLPKIQSHFAAHLGEPHEVLGLGLFYEPSRGADFVVLDWQSLGK